MAHRVFSDASGVTWEVWEVRPRGVLTGAAERRAADGAVGRPDPTEGGDVESDAGARQAPHERRHSVAAPLQVGWLAFSAGTERRRLAPIPPAWETATDAELALYCRAATPVPSPVRADG
jgi:hypothetical protein